jgi:hypothetical protein
MKFKQIMHLDKARAILKKCELFPTDKLVVGSGCIAPHVITLYQKWLIGQYSG